MNNFTGWYYNWFRTLPGVQRTVWTSKGCKEFGGSGHNKLGGDWWWWFVDRC